MIGWRVMDIDPSVLAASQRQWKRCQPMLPNHDRKGEEVKAAVVALVGCVTLKK